MEREAGTSNCSGGNYDDLLAIETDSDVYLSSLMMIAVVANRMLRNDVLDRIQKRLEQRPAALAYKAILDSAIKVEHSLLHVPSL